MHTEDLNKPERDHSEYTVYGRCNMKTEFVRDGGLDMPGTRYAKIYIRVS
jgi:hypothetical protein